jgi:hypothetical protein
MSSYEPNTALSRVTLASLSDLGYVIDPTVGDAYALPSAHDLALRQNPPPSEGLNLLPSEGSRRNRDSRWTRTPGRVLPEVQPVQGLD